MKIVQLLPMQNDYTYQCVVFGLGDDGNVYSWKNDENGHGWFLEMPCEIHPKSGVGYD